MSISFRIVDGPGAKPFPFVRSLCIFLSAVAVLLGEPRAGLADPDPVPDTAETVTICWNAPDSGADHFRVEIIRTRPGSETGDTDVRFTRETSIPVVVEPGFDYRARIQAADAFGVRSEYSEETSFSFKTLAAAESESLPRRYSLSQNLPNPFNPSTAVSFTLPSPGRVLLCIYNVRGQKMATLADGVMDAGTHSFVWNASGFSSGTYFCTMTAGGFRASRKMVLVK